MKRLYVGGVPYRADHEALAGLFRPLGGVESVHIVIDRMTGRSRGFGFVELSDETDALRVIEALDGSPFEGRTLTVKEARPLGERPWGIDALQKKSADVPTVDSLSLNAVEEPLLAEFLCDRPIIEVSNAVSIKLMTYLRDHPLEFQTMDRRRFEELIAEIFSGFGYTVELTKRTRDGGVDVIAIRKTIVAERYLIECKRPDPGNPVGIMPVRALYGVFASQDATKAILATTARFSKDATIFLHDHRWQIEGRDFDGLNNWIAEYLRLKGVAS